MQERNAIGIDPDSQGFVCAYVKRSDAKVVTRGYLATDCGFEELSEMGEGREGCRRRD